MLIKFCKIVALRDLKQKVGPVGHHLLRKMLYQEKYIPKITQTP